MAFGLLLSDDLLFTSRVTGTAQALGLTVQPVKTVAALQTAAQQRSPGAVILDLNHPGLVITDLMQWLGELPGGRPHVVGYGSHVDTATLKAARQAGCDEVMPRSQFAEEIANRLEQWIANGT
jgi:CheY-like chemotaxis protein